MTTPHKFLYDLGRCTACDEAHVTGMVLSTPAPHADYGLELTLCCPACTTMVRTHMGFHTEAAVDAALDKIGISLMALLHALFVPEKDDADAKA